MAQFVLGDHDTVSLRSGDGHDHQDDSDVGLNNNNNDIDAELDKRHYKKDSRYLEDLYTLTYDEDSSIDTDHTEVEEERMTPKILSTGMISLQVSSKTPVGRLRSGVVRSQSSGPMSLNILPSPPAHTDQPSTADPKLQFASSTLDTNLHKILARRLAGGQPVSYDSCKLLTKAYYKLLRDPAVSDVMVSNTVTPRPYTHNCSESSVPNWQALLKTDTKQLEKIVAGYTGLARSLNDQLVQELETKDELLSEQDKLLETISEMTDNLL